MPAVRGIAIQSSLNEPRNHRQAQRHNGGSNSTFSTAEQDLPHGSYLSFSRLALQSLRRPAGRRGHATLRQDLSVDAAGLLPAQPFNLVRIILGLPELFDAERGENVYTRAARDFRAWREQGVLIQENDPCIFAYAQRFKVPGTEIVKERRGFIALGKLHEYAEQVVFRHEQTLSKPKSDRLNLLKATRAHFGQIFMLYSDPAGSVEKILYEATAPPTPR